MEYPERPSSTSEVSHEVYYDIENEDSNGTKRQIRNGIGDGEGCWSEEFVASLFEEYWSPNHLSRHFTKGIQAVHQHR